MNEASPRERLALDAIGYHDELLLSYHKLRDALRQIARHKPTSLKAQQIAKQILLEVTGVPS